MAALHGGGTPAPRACTVWGARRDFMLAGLVLAIGFVLARPAPSAAEGLLKRPADPSKPSTSRAARQNALRAIPFEKLDAEARAKVASVLSDVSLFRRMPVRAVQCDPDLYLFLVQHPDVVVNIWELMGVTQLAVQQTGPSTFQVVDAAGTQGSIEYLYRSHDTHLIYSEGRYDGPLFARPVQGRGLLVLRTGYVREPDNRYYVTSRLDAFLRVDHLGAEVLTKTFQPLVGRVADFNFTQTAGFFGSLSRTAEVNYPGVQRLAEKLSKVQPEVRRRFAELARQVAQKADQPQDTAQQPQDPDPAGTPLIADRPGAGETN